MKTLSIAVFGLTFACATTPKAAVTARPSVLPPSLYTLKEGDKIQNQMPLPNKTKISVNWQNVEGKPDPVEGFRGWDLDHDGRFDMLEVLDEAGNTNMWAFDFDGDGVIDAVEGGKQVPSKAPMPQRLTVGQASKASATEASATEASLTEAVATIAKAAEARATEDKATSQHPVAVTPEASASSANTKADDAPFSDAHFDEARSAELLEKAPPINQETSQESQPVAH